MKKRTRPCKHVRRVKTRKGRKAVLVNRKIKKRRKSRVSVVTGRPIVGRAFPVSAWGREGFANPERAAHLSTSEVARLSGRTTLDALGNTYLPTRPEMISVSGERVSLFPPKRKEGEGRRIKELR